MFDLVRAFGPLLVALAVSVAVGAAALAVIRSVRGGANRAIIAAMPKYAPRGSVWHPAAGAWQGANPVAMAESNQSPFLRLGQLLTTAKYRSWMQSKLADAGLRGPIALRAQLVKKVTYAVVGAILGIALLTRWGDGGIVLVVTLIAIGFFLPDLLLVSEGQKRVEATERALPDAIDLLNLCVESGLSFENAMGRVSVSLDGPVAEEFGALIADLQLGKSRVDGLAALAERTKSKGLKQFASALLQVDRLGVPISGVLHEQATDMRAVRKDRAREQGQKVTIKILMPLMFCFLPAMFMIVLGPAIVQLVKTMSLL